MIDCNNRFVIIILILFLLLLLFIIINKKIINCNNICNNTYSEGFVSNNSTYKSLEKWTTDKYGNNLAHHTVDFDLYIKIAHNVNSAVPKNQFKNPLFNQFKIKKTDIPKNNYIYYL